MAVRRLAAALAVGAVLVVLNAPPAAAKLPYFTVELQPGVPAPGSITTVVVRTFGDAAHTVPTELAGLTIVPRLFCAYPPGRPAARPGACTGGIWVDVQRTAPNTFTGSVVFPLAGTWTLVSFPEVVGSIGAGYPDRIAVRVGGPGAGFVRTLPSKRNGSPDPAVFWLAAGLFVLLAVAGVLAERRRRNERVSS